MAGEDVCVGIIVLVVILVVIGIILKVISWSAHVAGGIGQYRTGKAMKKISNQGLLLQQPGQYQQYGPQSGFHQLHIFCAYCGTPVTHAGQTRCLACGREISWNKPANSVQPPAQINVKANGTKFCRHCGKMVLADSRFCEHCGNAL